MARTKRMVQVGDGVRAVRVADMDADTCVIEGEVTQVAPTWFRVNDGGQEFIIIPANFTFIEVN